MDAFAAILGMKISKFSKGFPHGAPRFRSAKLPPPPQAICPATALNWCDSDMHITVKAVATDSASAVAALSLAIFVHRYLGTVTTTAVTTLCSFLPCHSAVHIGVLLLWDSSCIELPHPYRLGDLLKPVPLR